MPEIPSKIDSQGERPTEYGDAGPGRLHSAGERPTAAVDFSVLDEVAPELAKEQRSVKLKPGDVVAGRFEVIGLLGFGGMGAVYRVKDRQLGGEKALKVMLPSLFQSKEARDRFRAEVGISQKLTHEHIVRVHDLATDSQRKFYFFTMEYVEGKTLHRVLHESGGKLSWRDTLAIMRQLCDALEYAHESTVHRDLKPQNIMVRPDGQIKVVDFGLAKLMTPGRMSRSSMALGTAYYQAPEQSVKLGEVDRRADIYSTGVILYQMLTGQLPLGNVRPPSRQSPGVPRKVDQVVMRCLEPEPSNRYTTAAELRVALNDVDRPAQPWKPLAAVAAGLALVTLVAWLWFGRNDRQTLPPEEAQQSTAQTQEPASSASAAVTQATTTLLAGLEPTHNVNEASQARRNALEAKGKAEAAGAQQHVANAYAEATELLKQAEAHDTLRDFDSAVTKYEAATTRFEEVRKEAAQIGQELARLEKARNGAKTAKTQAEELDAKTWAAARWQQAQEEEQAAAGTTGRPEAAARYDEAARLYALAVEESKQQGQSIVNAARKEAEQARDKAQTEDVKKYAMTEFNNAEGVLKAAADSTLTPLAAKAKYGEATDLYIATIEMSKNRKEDARNRAKEAKDDALALREQLSDEIRERASSEVQAGESAWRLAESAGDDFTKAETHWKEVQVQFERALASTKEPEPMRTALVSTAADQRSDQSFQAIRIAIPKFVAGPDMESLGEQLQLRIREYLSSYRSVEIVDPKGISAMPSDAGRIDFSPWRKANVNWLVHGFVRREQTNVVLECRLFKVSDRSQVLGKRLKASDAEIDDVARTFVNEVGSELSLVPGSPSTTVSAPAVTDTRSGPMPELEGNPEPQAIVDKFIEATGGVQAWNRVTSRIMKAKVLYVDAGREGTMTQYVQGSNAKMTSSVGRLGEVLSGMKDGRVWSSSDAGGDRLVEGDDASEYKESFDPQMWLHWQQYYVKAETVGEEVADGKTCWKVLFTRAHGAQITDWFDRTSGLLIQSVRPTVGGTPVTTTYKDYRSVGGLTLAHDQSIETPNGTVKFTIESYEFNSAITPANLKVPAGVGALINRH